MILIKVGRAPKFALFPELRPGIYLYYFVSFDYYINIAIIFQPRSHGFYARLLLSTIRDHGNRLITCCYSKTTINNFIIDGTRITDHVPFTIIVLLLFGPL